MNRKLIAILATGGFALAAISLDTTAQTTTPAAPLTGSSATGKPEHHPAIRAAIHALEKAKIELEHADHDFGGHRATALAECDKALQELRLALQYDKK